jgi:acetyl esterase/lipase
MAATRRPEQLPAFFDELAAWAEDVGGPTETVRYGDDPDQELDLRVPRGPGPHPVAIVLHGGFWRAGFTRRTTTALAVALTAAGWITANVEYRRLGPGAYRELLDDVKTAGRRFDAKIAIGHSAGGHLALWLAARKGAAAAVGLGAVCDLEAAARERLGRDAVREFLGDPPDYAAADPARMLPLGVPQVLVHGTRDDRVPLEHARAYAERAGAECRLLELEGADHFDVIDPRYPDFPKIVAALPR